MTNMTNEYLIESNSFSSRMNKKINAKHNKSGKSLTTKVNDKIIKRKLAKKATKRLYDLNHTTLSKHRKNGYDDKYDFISYNDYWTDYEFDSQSDESKESDYDYDNNYDYYNGYYDDYNSMYDYIMDEFRLTGRMNYTFVCGHPIRIVRI